MNEKIPVHNNTAMPIYVGAAMIPPGETRHFDADQVPPEHRPAPAIAAPEPPADPLAELLAELLAHSVAAIKEMLPALSDAELDALGAAEQQAAKPRTTLLGAIAEENLTRAEQKAAAAGEGSGEGADNGDSGNESAAGSGADESGAGGAE